VKQRSQATQGQTLRKAWDYSYSFARRGVGENKENSGMLRIWREYSQKKKEEVARKRCFALSAQKESHSLCHFCQKVSIVKVRKRRELLASNQTDIKSPDMMKELGKLWSNLTWEERAIYEEFANWDKQRYDREMKDFLDNGGDAIKLNEVESKWPKKCLSAYMIFVWETRKKI